MLLDKEIKEAQKELAAERDSNANDSLAVNKGRGRGSQSTLYGSAKGKKGGALAKTMARGN